MWSRPRSRAGFRAGRLPSMTTPIRPGCSALRRSHSDLSAGVTVSLRDVTLLGFRSVLSPEGFFVNDLGFLDTGELLSFAKGLGRSDEATRLLPTDEPAVFVPADDGRDAVHLEGPIVLLTSAEPGNFGSFLYRDLVKLVNLRRYPGVALPGAPAGRDLRTAFEADRPADGPGDRARHPRCVPHRSGDHSGSAVPARLRGPRDAQTLRTAARGMRQRRAGRRIYVSRQSVSATRRMGRVMLNEAELIDRLRPLGFDIVEPQLLTAAEQIAAFAAADVVVGPSGAGMFNAVFCRPGTRLIDIESEPHWIYPHSCLFASAELDYGIMEGLAADNDWSRHHKPWRVNIDALLRRIATIVPRKDARCPIRSPRRLQTICPASCGRSRS